MYDWTQIRFEAWFDTIFPIVWVSVWVNCWTMNSLQFIFSTHQIHSNPKSTRYTIANSTEFYAEKATIISDTYHERYVCSNCIVFIMWSHSPNSHVVCCCSRSIWSRTTMYCIAYTLYGCNEMQIPSYNTFTVVVSSSAPIWCLFVILVCLHFFASLSPSLHSFIYNIFFWKFLFAYTHT